MNLEKLKTIKSTNLIQDVPVLMTLYRPKEIVVDRVEVVLVSRPEGKISEMSDDDRYVVRRTDTDEEIKFKRNTCEPYFLISKYDIGDKNVNVRVKFEAEVSDNEKADSTKGKPGRPKKPEMFGPPAPPRKRGRPRKEPVVE